MREKPILFSSPMVRAILDGRKSQTRRIVKPQPYDGWSPLAVERYAPAVEGRDGMMRDGKEIFGAYNEDWGVACPYGGPGERLWVRETWWTYPHVISNRLLRDGADTWPMVNGEPIAYDADGDGEQWRDLHWLKKPSIHMPSWASRITLEITGVRVERVQNISEADAESEGADIVGPDGDHWESHHEAFAYLWAKLNGQDSWDQNPWVWVIEFKVLARAMALRTPPAKPRSPARGRATRGA